MIRIEFAPADIERLRYERFEHPHPWVQRRMEALLLKSQELAHQQIAQITGICENTLRTYFDQYQQGGIDRLAELHFYKPQSELKQHQQSLKAYLRQHPCATIKQARSIIKELTGIERSLTQVGHFLKVIGLTRRKVGSIPAKADALKQAAFKEHELEPKLEEAKAGKRAVLFVDAAHFVFAPFLGFLWCFERLFVRAPSGRQRFNVLGGLNAITHELITVTNLTYINAESVCALLRQIAKTYAGLPITLILDNARYQKCFLVQGLARTLGIELLYLPAYSPNLNLIERMWKFVKKQCLYSTYYPDFTSFSQAISRCLGRAWIDHQKELNSLLNLKFQSFDDSAQVLAAGALSEIKSANI